MVDAGGDDGLGDVTSAACLEAGTVGFQRLLGVREELLERLEQLVGGGDAVGVLLDVKPKSAVDLLRLAEGGERLHSLHVNPGEERLPAKRVPKLHRLSELALDGWRDRPRGVERQRKKRLYSGFGPGGESFVEPRVACLVVADQRVEPLVGSLVRYQPPGAGVRKTMFGYSRPLIPVRSAITTSV